MKIQIRPGLEIGDDCPPFIVAEVGSNWRTFEDCKNAVAQAKIAGADAVKFQAFTAEALYGPNPGGFLEHMQAVEKSAIPLDWLPKLKEKADACGIEFMCSAFSPALIDAVNPFVNVHKVASAELTHVRMLEKLKHIGKPVILSTGASGLLDIQDALVVLDSTPTALLYCLAAYPAREVDLERIADYRNRFGRLVGFSDHSTDVLVIPKAAADARACVIEKHVTFIDADTPDRGHSLTGDEFRKMVGRIRGVRDDARGYSHPETPMILRHNRRLIAVKPINPGDMLKEGENFDICRSLKDDTHALGPFQIAHVAGQTAKRAIAAGDGIGPGDF